MSPLSSPRRVITFAIANSRHCFCRSRLASSPLLPLCAVASTTAASRRRLHRYLHLIWLWGCWRGHLIGEEAKGGFGDSKRLWQGVRLACDPWSVAVGGMVQRERWQKPILRRFQPPTPVNDTNPYSVFRPREKTHRLHTRRMQRRENNVHSFEKLRQVRRNLDQAKIVLEALIKREERKRELTESEVSLQRFQIKYKHETELLEDSLALPEFPSFPGKFRSSEEEFVDSDDVANCRPRTRSAAIRNVPFPDSRVVMVSSGSMKQEFRHRNIHYGWLHTLDPQEPVLLFTKPLDSEKLAAACIVPPSESLAANSSSGRSYNFHGRIGRGGRIVFDRWNPLMHTPIDCGNSFYIPPRPLP
ncbi:hypothetical protein U1Q18_002738 [Sarracenia purpurea var. burkii]